MTIPRSRCRWIISASSSAKALSGEVFRPGEAAITRIAGAEAKALLPSCLRDKAAIVDLTARNGGREIRRGANVRP